MFWSKFVPAFPVVHQPTFIFKDWTYPLLLNAIALGSLFTGQEDDKIKVENRVDNSRHKKCLLVAQQGEILWRLAHTSVATSVSYAFCLDSGAKLSVAQLNQA